MSDDLRNRVARAIANVREGGWPADTYALLQQHYLTMADAALAEIGASLRSHPELGPQEPEKYAIGDLTMDKVFRAAGLTNVSDMQAVFDQVEVALRDTIEPAPVSVREAARVLLGDRWRGYENKDAREAMWDHVHDVHGRHMLPMSAYSGVLIAALRAIAEGKE
jgi:hypothetical protein